MNSVLGLDTRAISCIQFNVRFINQSFNVMYLNKILFKIVLMNIG